MKGIPVRIAIGPRDLENNTLEVARRDTLEKQIVPIENIKIMSYNYWMISRLGFIKKHWISETTYP